MGYYEHCISSIARRQATSEIQFGLFPLAFLHETGASSIGNFIRMHRSLGIRGRVVTEQNEDVH